MYAMYVPTVHYNFGYIPYKSTYNEEVENCGEDFP